MSKPFHTERGVRQGCVMPPKLFNLYGEYIMGKALEDVEVAVTIGGRKITNLRYADDFIIAESNVEDMAFLLKKVHAARKRFPDVLEWLKVL